MERRRTRAMPWGCGTTIFLRLRMKKRASYSIKICGISLATALAGRASYQMVRIIRNGGGKRALISAPVYLGAQSAISRGLNARLFHKHPGRTGVLARIRFQIDSRKQRARPQRRRRELSRLARSHRFGAAHDSL